MIKFSLIIIYLIYSKIYIFPSIVPIASNLLSISVKVVGAIRLTIFLQIRLLFSKENSYFAFTLEANHLFLKNITKVKKFLFSSSVS